MGSFRNYLLILLMLITALVEPMSPRASDDAKTLFSEAIEAHWKWDLDTAIQLYTRVIALDSNNARAYFNRGVAYRSKGDEKPCPYRFHASDHKGP